MIHRSIDKPLYQSLEREEITILVGARQVGKTTLLQSIMNTLRQHGERVLFLNMDIESDARMLDTQDYLVRRIRLEFGENFGYVFIDEIQHKKDAGRFLKGLYDMRLNCKFVVTGSGSLELKEKISEALTGRKHLIEMYPVSFHEFVDYKTAYSYSDRLDEYCRLEKSQVMGFLDEYLAFGGYPKVITSDTSALKYEVMEEIFSSYITKDITYLLGVRSPDRFIRLIQLLAVQCGGVLNYAQLATDVGIAVDTVKNYLWYAEQTFVIENVKPFFTNSKKELIKSPTVYFNDLGMCNYGRNRYGLPVSESDGFLFQNFIFQLLRNRFKRGVSKINYWRTKDKAEVDFIIHDKGEAIPVEVKFSESKKPAISRSFRSFIDKYQPSRAYVVSLSDATEIILGPTRIAFIPFWHLMFEFPA
ncbi:MAG: ATP-binding protein [Bacteroidota bacterium]